jgi:hypothetical protein
MARSLLFLSVAASVALIAYAVLAGGNAAVAAGCGAYLVVVAAGNRIVRRRSRRLPEEHVGLVRDQLGRVRSTLGSD